MLGAEGRGEPGADTPGAAAPGIAMPGGAFGASPIPGGMGCLGPDKIWPGRGAGTGLAGIAEPLIGAELDGTGIEGAAGAWGGTRGGAGAACGIGIAGGCPIDSGGRNGGARRTGGAGTSSAAFVSWVSLAISTAGASVFTAGFAEGCRTGSGAGVLSCGLEPSRAAGAASPPVTRRRTSNATSSSSELECVFLSATPSSANVSRITLGFTSSSRASSLMRILLIQ
jgi:hypothetical protein